MLNSKIGGLKVVTVDWMFEDGYVPRRYHKKKRIQKKWIKRYGYSKRIKYKFIIDKDRLYCHSKMLKRLEKEINKSK